jgi:predicted small secreted protein
MEIKLMKSLMSYLAILLFLFSLNGCNTFSGMGKDLQAGGKAITNAANEVSPSSTTTKKTTNNQTIGNQVTTTETTRVTTTQTQ